MDRVTWEDTFVARSTDKIEKYVWLSGPSRRTHPMRIVWTKSIPIVDHRHQSVSTQVWAILNFGHTAVLLLHHLVYSLSLLLLLLLYHPRRVLHRTILLLHPQSTMDPIFETSLLLIFVAVLSCSLLLSLYK